MSHVGWIGVGLLVAAGLAIVVEGVLMAVWTATLLKRARLLAETIDRERGLVQADLERLQLALEETRRLWRPYRRILRWLRHPLVVALIGSYRRRWAAR